MKIENLELFWINDAYLPVLGKCEVGTMFDEEAQGSKVMMVGLRPVRVERKDENGIVYTISTPVIAKIDFNKNTISGTYYKRWIGGLVEEFKFEHKINLIDRGKDKVTEVHDVDIYTKVKQ